MQLIPFICLDCDANNNCPHPSECARCNNGGTCQDDIGSYSCACPAGYTGEHCEVDINYCQPNLCQVTIIMNYCSGQQQPNND